LPINGVGNKMHVMTVGAVKIGVKLPDVYDGIASAVGIRQDTGDPPDIVMGANDLVRNGQAIRIRISYPSGTRAKYGTVLCAIDEAKTAVGNLIGKTYRGGTIKTAGFPTRRRLS